MEKVFIFSAPSGAGKTTIIKHLLQKKYPMEFSVSATSRAKREGEVHGKDYYFLSANEFRAKIENDEFLEWEEVYEDNFYGTLKSEVQRIWENGSYVLFDVDVAGGVNLKKYFGYKALAVFVQPPSIHALEERLIKRSTDSLEAIRKRVAKAEYELTFADKFDKILVNDVLEKTLEEAETLVLDFINT